MLKLAVSRGSSREIMAFGDELNDLSMLRAAGKAMRWPTRRTKCGESRLFRPSNSEDGLAQVLEKPAPRGVLLPGRAQ